MGTWAKLWRLCDVAVCRSGATTVAELTALGIPSLLVPLPHAPGDHQTKNAQALAEHGAALVVADAQCDAETLAKLIEEIAQPLTRSRMADAAKSLGHLDSSARIARSGARRAEQLVKIEPGTRVHIVGVGVRA